MQRRDVRIGLGLRSLGLTLVILTQCLGCGGRSTVKLYDGDPRSLDQIATIESWSSTKAGLSGAANQTAVYATFVMAVDDRTLSDADRDGHASIQVAPGTHRLVVGANFLVHGKSHSSRDPEPLEFDAEAGQRYVIRARTEMSGQDAVVLRFRLEDSSGTIVAGTK